MPYFLIMNAPMFPEDTLGRVLCIFSRISGPMADEDRWMPCHQQTASLRVTCASLALLSRALRALPSNVFSSSSSPPPPPRRRASTPRSGGLEPLSAGFVTAVCEYAAGPASHGSASSLLADIARRSKRGRWSVSGYSVSLGVGQRGFPSLSRRS